MVLVMAQMLTIVNIAQMLTIVNIWVGGRSSNTGRGTCEWTMADGNTDVIQGTLDAAGSTPSVANLRIPARPVLAVLLNSAPIGNV